MAENTTGGLSAAEQAYFDSEGETHFEETANEEAQAQAGDEAKTGILDNEAQQSVEGQGDEQPVRDEKGRFVNYGALHQERERRKELEGKVSKLEDTEKKLAVLEDRWQTLVALNQQPEKQEDPEPDRNVDIFAHNAWLSRELAREKQARVDREQTETQARQAEEGEKRVWTFWNQDAAAYKAETPEFEDAVKWMSDTRTKQLKALSGLHPQFKTDAGIVQQINKELFEITVAAAQNGVRPAKYIHDMAKEWGYQGKAPDPGKIELPDKLKGVDKAQAASRTVGQGAGGAAGGDEMSIDTLAKMPQGEFNEWMKVPANEKTFRRLMGG